MRELRVWAGMIGKSASNALQRLPFIIGMTALALFILAMILPGVIAQQFLAGLSGMLWRGSSSVETGRGPVAYSAGGIISRAQPDSRTEQMVKLADLAAERYEAGGMLRRLRFVGVRFTTDGAGDRMVSPAEREARRLALELNMPKELGTVIISSEPVAWAVNNTGARERARIGFEGVAPFAIKAESGTLSGFRIGAFGAGRNAYPVDPVDETRANLKRFCESLLLWGQHFSVEIDRMEYVLLTNPASVSITDMGATAGGRSGTHYSGSTLRTLCFGPQSSGRSNGGGRPIYNRVTRQWN